ncbi:MAG: S49 family peptidase, partial [Succinivibrio sp.]
NFKLIKKIPVIISMNGTAASGAYWIATEGSRIFLTGDTITGSIGVFSLGINVHKLLNENGIYQDGVATSELAGRSIAKRMPESQVQLYNMHVLSIYKNFLDIVIAKRPALKNKPFTQWAEGRVFLGKDAVNLGLADDIGDLQKALDFTKLYVKRLNNIKDKNIEVFHVASGRNSGSMLKNIFAANALSILTPKQAEFILDIVNSLSKANSADEGRPLILASSPVQSPSL